MAQSRKGKSRARHIRKLKRRATLATHVLKARTTDYFNVVTALLSVLAQQGGEVTVTQGTVSQAVQEFVEGQLSWAMVRGKVDGEFVVRLVTREAPKVVGFDSASHEDMVNGAKRLTEESDALLAQEGVPDFGVIQQIGRDDVD